jgi:N,N'-diacetyllegionaminate synthase
LSLPSTSSPQTNKEDAAVSHLVIDGREFSSGHCLVIGEVAQAHDGSLGMAHAYIDAIADARADAVKFQTHIAAAESSPGEPWRVQFSSQDAARYDYWKRMEFTEEHWQGLKRHADQRNLIFLSSPFSLEAIQLLQRVGVPAWKVASGEVGNLQLLQALVQTRLPVLLSTGMSPLTEIDAAVELLKSSDVPLAVLQCTSEYPAAPENIGLNLLEFFRNRYSCPVGLSDHSGTIYPGLAAATLGAQVLEVHVTLSREMFGPDVSVSVTSAELGQLVEGIRFIQKIMASRVDKDDIAREMMPLRDMFTRSVFARMELPAGTILREEHLTSKKPGTGIPAARLPQLIGASLKRSVTSNQMLLEEDLEYSR